MILTVALVLAGCALDDDRQVEGIEHRYLDHDPTQPVHAPQQALDLVEGPLAVEPEPLLGEGRQLSDEDRFRVVPMRPGERGFRSREPVPLEAEVETTSQEL